MTGKFRQIIEELNHLVTFKVDRSISDNDFTADVEGINLLCNTYDDLGLDYTDIRKRMNALYPQFSRRVYGKKDIQFAVPLIKALHEFIYGRSDGHSPKQWRNTLAEMCCKVVDSYRKNPLIEVTEYLFALDIVCRLSDDADNPDITEYKEAIANLLKDIEDVSLAERIKRVRAYERARLLFTPDNWKKWVQECEELRLVDLSGLDDKTFILWREITDVAPMKELKRRAGNSKRMQVEYVEAQIFTEFARESRLKAKRKLTRDLKTLNGDIIGDIIPVKINADMSIATLYSLETIFYLRLQLAQLAWDDNEPVYESLCHDRLTQIAKALTKKYKVAESLNEKIEILERLSAIGQLIHSDDIDFAINEASNLLSDSCCGIPAAAHSTAHSKPIASLSQSQKLRLEWIPNINSDNESQIVAELLPKADTAFDMATLALISDYVNPQERESIFNRFIDLFDAALVANDSDGIGNLLAVAAYWNSDPLLRQKLKKLTKKAKESTNLDGDLSEARILFRLNQIAAEIYSRIDKITGKYDILSA